MKLTSMALRALGLEDLCALHNTSVGNSHVSRLVEREMEEERKRRKKVREGWKELIG